MAALEGATDMVFSRFHGDHVPLFKPNPYQLGFSHLPPRIKILRVWSLSPAGQSHTRQARARDLADLLGRTSRWRMDLLTAPCASPMRCHMVSAACASVA